MCLDSLRYAMRKISFTISVCLATLVIATGCSGYNKLIKSKDKELMYAAAMDYFNQGKFDKTLQLFDEIGHYYQGTQREDSILFYTADAHFRSANYQLSCMEFDDFRQRFGRSPFVEEAEYKYAMGYYYMSPEPDRDVTPTLLAIRNINEYLQRYPESSKKQLCMVRLDELQQKLYEKSFLNASTYYKIGRYKSAVTALKNALKEFPQSPYREQILYLTVKSHYELASNSIASLQKDRYLNMIDSYYTFISEFPESKYRRELDRLQHAAWKFVNNDPDSNEDASDDNNSPALSNSK